MKLLDGVKADAVLSDDGMYRYALTRDWFPKTDRSGHVLWIMLNPSTADADVDDPTIRRCQAFARAWGFDGITVVNLYAYRSTDPKALRTVADPIGEANDDVIESYFGALGVGRVVCAWGANPMAAKRVPRIKALARDADRALWVLGTTKDGQPQHPLYISATREPTIEQP